MIIRIRLKKSREKGKNRRKFIIVVMYTNNSGTKQNDNKIKRKKNLTANNSRNFKQFRCDLPK